MGSARIHGTGLTLTIGTVDHFADCTAVVMDHEDATTTSSWGMPAHDVGRWFFDVTAVQSTAPGSLWSLLFAHALELHPFRYAPHGNTAATKAMPHFTGTVNLGRAPALGGQAGEKVTYTFTTRLFIQGRPVMVNY